MSNPDPIGGESRDKMKQTHEGYPSSHPWYYVLGGKRLSLKEIREETRASGYRGYMAREIDEADALAEPRRSQTLRAMGQEARTRLALDVSSYRQMARELARYRAGEASGEGSERCAPIHMAISLKHNHISNCFAHLIALDELLAKQGDLFDL